MKNTILTITLNPAIDRIVTVDRFGIGKTALEKSEAFSAGGKGINVSRTLKHFRIPNVATGLLGSCTGMMIKSLLDKEKIQNDFVKIKQNTRTSLTIVDAQTKISTRVLQRGPKVSQKEIQQFIQKFKRHLRRSNLVVLSGRNANGVSDNIYADLIRIAAKEGVPCILDSHGKSFHLGIKAKPFCISPNKEEAEKEMHCKLNSVSQFKKAVRYFQRKGIEVVVISLGEKGAVASGGEEIWLATPVKIFSSHTVGCGDAFLGGFIKAWQKGQSMDKILSYSVATGSASALRSSPGSVQAKDIDQIQKKVKVRKI